MGSGLSYYSNSRSNQYVVKKVPKQWEQWDEVHLCWNSHGNAAEYSISSWDFNIWNLDIQQLFTLSFMIIHTNSFSSLYSIRTETWFNLMSEVQGLMSTTNPYHNLTHILDVMQTANTFIHEYNGKNWLNDGQIFSVLIAALVHDLEHPGTNNLYQVNASTSLAIRYNDMAVLENHHCSRAFELFSQPGCNIFAAFGLEQRKVMRKYIIAMVLATDMSVHFGLKDEVEACVTRLSSTGPPKDTLKLEDKDALTIMKAIVHTADISNPAKQWEISRRWSDKVIEEFFLQGDREKKEHLLVSPNCDRLTTNQDELSINFTDFIVAPFYFSITKLLPAAIKACRLLEDNRNAWNNLLTARLGTDRDRDRERDRTDSGSKAAESKTEEVIVKWESRKAAFTEKMRDLSSTVASL